MQLAQICIVLVETSHPGNIGSTARAMKAMGLTNLCLVNPCNYKSQEAIALAAGATDILANASVYSSLEEALQNINSVFGTSARARGLPIQGVDPEQCAKIIEAGSTKANIAIVFGRERTGLTNKELLLCNYHVHIPTEETFSSLNLAQSVQIVAYELRKQILKPKIIVGNNLDPIASVEQVLGLHQHWIAVLNKIKFLKESNADHIKDRMLRILNKLQPDEREIRMFRGMLTKIEYMLAKNARN